MPIYSRKEYAALCSVTPSYVNVNIKRGKVVLDKNGNVDDSEPINAHFKMVRTKPKEATPPPVVAEESAGIPETTTVKKVAKKTTRKTQKGKHKKADTIDVVSDTKDKAPLVRENKKAKDFTEVQPEEDIKDPTNEEALMKWKLDLEAKELDVEKKRQDIELAKIKIAKAQGEVIPTDLVNLLFGRHFKEVTTAFHQGADNFIMTIAKQLDLGREEVARLRGELILIVNDSVKKAIRESKRSVKNIVGEYSESRGKGESK